MDISPEGRIDVVWYDSRFDADGPTGTFINRLMYAYSIDGGQTWSDNLPIGPLFDTDVGEDKIGDYIQIVSDRTGAHVAFTTTYNGVEHDISYARIGDYDCDANGVGDSVQIQQSPELDANDNGILDCCESCACP